MKRSTLDVHLTICCLILALMLASCARGTGSALPTAPQNMLGIHLQPSKVNENTFLFVEDGIILRDKQDPVSQLCFQEKTSKLFSAYPTQGALITWDLNSKQMLSEFDLGINSPVGINFSNGCYFMIGATQYEFRYGKMYIEGIKVWDTSSGVEVRCVSTYCDGNSLHPDEIGAAIDLTGKSDLVYSEISVLTSMSGGLFVRGPNDNSPTIGLVSFSPVPDTYAIAYQEGKVDIFYEGPSILKLFSSHYSLGQNNEKDIKPVYALTFDSTGQLVGRIRGESLTIWRKSLFSSEIVFDEKLSGQKLLQFDATGKYVFVAGSDKLIIWSIDENKIIAEYSTIGITSMIVSIENNIVIWGDKLGTIHIMRNHKSS